MVIFPDLNINRYPKRPQFQISYAETKGKRILSTTHESDLERNTVQVDWRCIKCALAAFNVHVD